MKEKQQNELVGTFYGCPIYLGRIQGLSDVEYEKVYEDFVKLINSVSHRRTYKYWNDSLKFL